MLAAAREDAPRLLLSLANRLNLMIIKGALVVCRVPECRPLPANNLAMPWNEFPAWLAGELASDDGAAGGSRS